MNLKKMIKISFVLIMFAASVQYAEKAKEDTLWQKAKTIAQVNKDWIPGFMISHVKMLNRKGKVKSHEEIWSEIKEKNNKIDVTVVKLIKNGKDITEKYKKKEEKRKKKNKKKKKKEEKNTFSFDLSDNPFYAKIHNKVHIEATEEREEIMGKKCVIYKYTQEMKSQLSKKKKAVKREGRAWLQEESGFPLKIEFSLNPLPKHTKKFLQTIKYSITDEGHWYVKELNIEGSGGILFIKKYFHSTTFFSKYFKYSKNKNP